MCIAVKHDFVHALTELAVTDRLENFRILRKSIVVCKGSEGFTGNHWLAVNVPRSGGLFGVVLTAPPLWVFVIRFAAEPELAHRNIHLTLHLNLVCLNRHTDSRCFSGKFDVPFMHVVGKGSVKIIGKQVTDGAAVVPEETFCFIETPHKSAGQRDQPFRHVITTTGCKLFRKFCGPSLAVCFPTIDAHFHRRAACQVAQALQNFPGHPVVQVMIQRLLAKFIHFQAFCTIGGRMNQVTIGRMTKAQNRPLTGRQVIIQAAVLLQISRQVENLIHCNHLIGGNVLLGEIGNCRMRAHPGRFRKAIGQTSGLKIELVELHRHTRLRGRNRKFELHKFHGRIRKPLNECFTPWIEVLHPAPKVR